MECPQVKAIVFKNPDLDIPPEVREGVEAHLAGCPSCARQFLDLKEQIRALGSLPRMEAPPDFLRQVRSRLDKPSALQVLRERLGNIFGGNRFFQLAGVAVSAALVILVAQVALKEGTVQKAVLSPQQPAITTPAPEPAKPEATSPSLPSPAPAPSAPSAEPGMHAGMPLTAPSGPQALMVPAPKQLPGPGSAPDAGSMERAYARQKSESQAGAALEAKQAPLISLTLKPGRRKSPSVSPYAPTSESPLEGGKGGVSLKAKSAPNAGFSTMQADSAGKSKSGAAARREETTPSAAAPEERDIFSEVKRLVLDADGNIINGGLSSDEKRSETLVADMPAANYPPFLGRLGQLGEVSDGNGATVAPSPGSNVRVKIKLDMRE